MSATCLRRRSAGFAAPLAVFVILLGAVVAAAITVFSSTQQTGAALDLLGARGYQTARAGLEWGAHHVLRGTLSCAAINDLDGPGAGSSFSAPAVPGFTVTVTCAGSTHAEADVTVTMYAVSATACNLPAGGPPLRCPNAAPGSPTYVERQLRVIVGSN